MIIFSKGKWVSPYVVFKGKKGLKLINQILNTPPRDEKEHEEILKELRIQEKEILKMREERLRKKLMSELEKGEISAKEKGWIDAKEVEEELKKV